MKKLLTVLSLIMLLSVFGGCHSHEYLEAWSSNSTEHWHVASCHEGERGSVATHNWVNSGNVDSNGDVVYTCATCGYVHEHVLNAEAWAFNGRGHWHPAECGHDDAFKLVEEHDYNSDGVCSVCACNQSEVTGYEVAFAYYVVDENGTPTVDGEGNYVETGVTYTSLEQNGCVSVDPLNTSILYAGDVVKFTVKKSVFCYYNDGADRPLVEIITKKDGTSSRDAIDPDDNGVYTVKIEGDTVISVANVRTSPKQITGEGTKESPFIINSEVDWLYFAMYVNDKSFYSLTYNIGYWELNADLDFEGETIYVIGDGFSSSNSVFCGNFNGNGHTISNFTLDNSVTSESGGGYSNYLGLFGVVTGYAGVDSVISNLNLENVKVNATAGEDDIVVAGGIVGYGVGANVRNCTAKNVEINVIADDTYMSYAGGLVGFLQSGMTDDGMLFYASIGYSVAENVTIKGSGMLYNAGGIVGRVVSYSNQVTAFVINSYSSGNITNATRSGGIAGELQRYGSIQNCYSTATVSAYSTIKDDVNAEYSGTSYDDRYSYAGGVVGYVENDTVVEGCFFDGSVYATALAGKAFGKQANIVAGISKEGFSDYYAKAAVLNNQLEGDSVNNDYLKNQFGWSEADWSFGEGYPTINQEEATRAFTVSIDVDGTVVNSFDIDSQYLPLSYWYLLSGNGQGIARYYLDGAKRTYGYYFDSGLTKPVPVGYVPMGDVTLYASYKDTKKIEGSYFVANDGVSVEIVISTDGTYTYEEGAIFLTGEYYYDGEIITFENAVFSRVADTATALQKNSYYTFWAKVQENGNLHIFDCEEIYLVTSEEEEQSATFTAMARFYAESNPLKAISSKNLSFVGDYYYTDLESKYVFQFNNDYTGTFKKYTAGSTVSDRFTFKMEGGNKIVVTLNTNGASYTATLKGNALSSIKDNRGDSYSFYKVDDFVGTWEKEATTHKIYTFDGMGNWTYEHYVYLTSESLATASKQIVSQDGGTYVVEQGVLKFTREENGATINVKATIADGVISVTENDSPVQVEFTNLNGYKGVWYTANNKITRYTLALKGLNAKGVGIATLDGFNTAPLTLRYTAVNQNTLYLYIDNVVYAILNYSAKTGTFEGLFYSSSTGSTTTPQTLYLYDDFAGNWISDISAISSIKFNGFGAYNTSDATGNTLAVKGSAVINGTTNVDYTYNRQTEKAEFTYKGVTYTLMYNEYSDSISASYKGQSGIIAKADIYAGVVLYGSNGTTLSFDGRGEFAQGGTLKLNSAQYVYKISSGGDITIFSQGVAVGNIAVAKAGGVITGYALSLNGGASIPLYVENAFTGTWAIPGKNLSIRVGTIPCIVEKGNSVKVNGSYNGKSVNMQYNGETISFEYGGKAYSLVNVIGGKASAIILTETTTIYEAVTEEFIIVKQDNFFGTWTKNNTTSITFDGCGASDYVTGSAMESNKNSAVLRKYKIENGIVKIYDNNGNLYATFEECSKVGGAYVDTENAYVKDNKYYQLKLV